MKNYVFKLLDKYDYNWKKVYKAIKEKEFVADEEVEKYQHYEDFMTILHEKYPEQLKFTSTPPFALFFKGDENILNKLEYSTFIYGGEKLTPYGEDLCNKIVETCKSHNAPLIVCSWTNIGKYSIKKALEHNTSLVVIHSCGRDKEIWKKDLKNSVQLGLFLDHESSNELRMEQSMWLAAALCHRCIVPEIELERGKMKLIDECLSMGKKVYAYPRNVDSENQGTNYLIKQGATLLM